MAYYISTPINKNMKENIDKWQLSPVKSIYDKCIKESNDTASTCKSKNYQDIENKCYTIGPYKIKNLNLETLNDHEWLDDNIINSFIYSRTFSKLILENHVKVTLLDSCFFLSLLLNGSTGHIMMKRGLSLNILKSDIILAPVCHENHWTLIVVDRSKRIISQLDSLHGKIKFVLQTFSDFILTLEKTYNKHCGLLDRWKVCKPSDLVLQKNSFDCGVHVCLYADIICNGKGKIPKGNLINKRKYLKDKIKKSSESNLPRIEDRNVRIDSTNILIENKNIEILTKFPKISSQIYLQNMVMRVFKTTKNICLLGPKCLKPKDEKTMIFCDGCHDWYHRECLDDKNNYTILNDSNSFLCNTCKT